MYLTKSTRPVLTELFDCHIMINSLQRAQLQSLNIIFIGGLTLWAQTVTRSLRSAFRHERISSVVLNHFSAYHQGASAVFFSCLYTHSWRISSVVLNHFSASIKGRLLYLLFLSLHTLVALENLSEPCLMIGLDYSEPCFWVYLSHVIRLDAD